MFFFSALSIKLIRLFGMAKMTAAAPQARSALTRQRLLDAARKLLAEGGPAAVTHRAVAETADVSLGATTYHFATKEELLAEVYRTHLLAIQERANSLSHEVSPTGKISPKQRRTLLTQGLLSYLEAGVKEDRSSSLATFELALERARNPALRRRLRSAQEASDSYAVEMLRELGAGDPELDAPLVISALNGLRMQWLAAGERSAFAEQVPALIGRLADWLLRGD